MYLKSLVLHGFKSFAQRVELHFPKGVTAIVGPNGSGKSNVSDAIRWVLGEQNIRSLRGSAMQDVIFAGSDSRRPLGMAEVSIILDNSDFTLPLEFEEISITRRTYRSGESEFLINGTSCRLRDIHELLMDTGLGRGTLSVIGQGEVDAILSVRPEERRQLIEEAAGVTRYRTRRQEALDRLRETEADLQRINDIIGEVEKQLSPLEKEAERARIYRALRSELSEVERRVLLHEWAVRKDACREWEEKREAAQRVWSAAKDALADLQGKRRESLSEAARLQERLATAQEALVESERSADKHQAEARVLAERLVALQSEVQRRNAEQALLTEQAAEKARRRDETIMGIETLRQAEREAEALVHEVEYQLKTARERLQEADSLLRTLRSQTLSRLQQAADVQSELNRMATAIEERRAELLERQSELQAVLRQLDEAVRERENALSAATELEAARDELQALANGMGKNLAELQKARQSLVEKAQSIRGRLTGLLSQREALKALDDSYEGFAEGVRACLQADRPWRSKVYGAVGGLLTVESEHETAIEVALGGSAQNIVVEDEETAKQAIAFLKETRAGRVTFLPLASLRLAPPLRLPDWLVDDPEYLGLASDLVRFDPAIERAVQYLLGRVLVARTLDGAVRFSRVHQAIQRVVSLEGDLVLSSGPITGGYRRRQQGSGLLSRRRRLDELDKQVEAVRGELRRFKEQLDQVDAQIEETQNGRADVEGRLQSVLRAVADNHRLRDVLRERIGALEEQKDRIETVINKLEGSIQELVEQHQQTLQQLDSLDLDKQQQHFRVEQLEKQLETLRTECTALEALRAQRREAWLAAVNTVRNREAELERTEAEIAELQERLASEEQELAALGERIERTALERQRALELAAMFEKAASEQREAIARLQAELARFQQVIDDWNEKEEAARKAVEASADELHRIEVALERERVAYIQAEERLIEQEIPIPSTTNGITVDGIEPLKARMRRLRRSLDELGDVNVNALEEYAALKDRYAFLTAQRDDLVEAYKGLEKAIADMDQTSRERLVAAFDAIQEALAGVFPRLFGGGRARLSWTDPEEPLESGIDMMVQPPGKRPQPLLTLSGGERALAAASLLFAIMSVRPSPFFVLDEVDAALDEANVDRFAQLLKEYGQRTQIIVITHRQGTMERADALFGVTMERHGTSQLVSLRLDDVAGVGS